MKTAPTSHVDERQRSTVQNGWQDQHNLKRQKCKTETDHQKGECPEPVRFRTYRLWSALADLACQSRHVGCHERVLSRAALI